MQKPAVEILYQDHPRAMQEDADILVINKPSGLSVTRDRSGKPQLLDILTEQLGPEAAGKLRLVHRLDKDTSGVMVLAKNTETQSRFSSYFENKLVNKTYLALVTGRVPDRQGTIDAPLAHSSKNPALMRIDRKRGKTAVTRWTLLAEFGNIALLAVNPETGRTHQIRVHLPGIGLPLTIDPLYGSNRPLFLSDFKTDYHLGREKTEKPLIDRLTLHAYELLFLGNCANCPTSFVAAADRKFTAALKMLTKHNPRGLDAFINADHFSRIINHQSLS
jgi:RluA family pseudouridine synthase